MCEVSVLIYQTSESSARIYVPPLNHSWMINNTKRGHRRKIGTISCLGDIFYKVKTASKIKDGKEGKGKGKSLQSI